MFLLYFNDNAKWLRKAFAAYYVLPPWGLAAAVVAEYVVVDEHVAIVAL